MEKIKVFLSLIILITFLVTPLSCSIEGDENPNINNNGSDGGNRPEPEPDPVNPNLFQVNVSVDLPEGTPFSQDELVLNSAFTENKPISNGRGLLEIFKKSTNELVFASTSDGNILLLSYTSSANSSLVLNAESTALALIMMDPWTFDLTDNAKAEAVTYIKSLPEFTNYKQAIESSIASGDLNPLTSENVLNKLIAVQTSLTSKLVLKKTPLLFNVDEGVATITNQLSSAAYSVGLYDDKNQLFGHELAVGIEKLYYFFPDFQNLAYGNSDNLKSTIKLDIPLDGRWELRAKSGLSFDGSLENQQAAYHNSSIIIMNILGMFSSDLKKLLSESTQCTVSSGELLFKSFFGQLSYQQNLKKYVDGEISDYEFTKSIIEILRQYYDELLVTFKTCFPNSSETVGEMLGSYYSKLLNLFNAVYKTKTAFNTGAMVADWKQYDSEIEMCFIKEGDQIIACQGLQFSGDLNFGNVFIGQSFTKTLSITNIDEAPIEILEFSTPDRVYIDVINKVIQVGETIQVDIKFEPQEAKDYSGEVRAIGSGGEVLGRASINAIGAKSFTLENDLDFGQIPINTSATKQFTIKNNLDTQLNVSISFPLGFGDYVQTGVTIEPGQSKVVDVSFTPTSVKEYIEEITVDSNKGTATIPVRGTGIAGGSLQITGNLNFGEVMVGNNSATNITIYNNGTTPINVSTIEFVNLLNTCEVDGFTNGMIEPGTSKSTLVRFTPTEVKEYSGYLQVNNDSDQENNTIAITGIGIENTGSMSLSGNLNFGDVAINTSSAKTLTITNNGSSIIKISSINLPDGFTTNWTSGSIGANASQDVIITFLPALVQQYSGNLVVNNDLYQDNNTIILNGNGIDSDATISIEGDLDFGVVPIDEPNEKTITIINNSQSSVNISSINLPSDYFETDWNSGTISSGGSQSIIITFTPTEIKDYTGTLVIDNDLDNVNNKVNITGRGSKLFADALAVKEILKVNGKDVSDRRWNSKNFQEVSDVISQNNGVVINERIRELHWTEYGLTIMPSEIGQLDGLWTAGFALNSISSIPQEIGNLKELKLLALNYNDLSYLPENLGDLISLEQLHINNNKLVSLPFSIGNLTKLSQLRLAKNLLSSLPSSISNLISLEHLWLETNKFQTLPSYIGSLPKLRFLYASFNELTSLPSEIGNLTTLQTLNLDNNNLGSLPETIGNLTALFDLILHHNRLTSLPNNIINLNRIVRLELNDNNLTSLPSSIGNLSTLKFLHIFNNSLSSLPESIGNLNLLYDLNLSYNNLTSLPNSIGNLTQIGSMPLNNNKLTSLPDSFKNLTKLTSLYLQDNNFTSAPSFIDGMTDLRILSLGNNNLSSFPAVIVNMTFLKELYLTSNNISSVPSSVGNLTNLTSLWLGGNGLKCLPQAVWNLGCNVIIAGLSCGDTDCSD
jgi:Leucine-rich repeat (LRR) protein